ncbi:hypothetical protein [Algoriphagus taiwanensis]
MNLQSIFPSRTIRLNKVLFPSLFFFLSLFFLPSCELFETEVEDYLLQFNSADGSIDQLIANGQLLIDGVETGLSTSNIQELSVSNEFISLKFTLGNDTFYFRAPNNGRSGLDLVDNYLDEATTFLSNVFTPISGIGGVSRFTIEAKDTYEGSGDLSLVVVGDFQSSEGGASKQIVFDFDIDFDTSRTGGLLGSGGGSGGGTDSGGSGSGSGSCINEIKAPTLVSYWGDQIRPVSQVTGTGKKVAGNTIFSDYKSSDVGLVIDGTSGDTRYVIQILLTPGNLVANKRLDFINAGAGAGLTNAGAVGRLIALKGSINDDWRTNRDFGKNKDTGNLFIESVSPQIRGTYEFEAYGDGYDNKTNKQLAKVSGSFCIDP